MTVIRPNGISGITSITSSGDAINFFKSDGTLGPVLGLNINATSGISTFAALNVTGVLTYEDVTSVDSVGIITARSDLSIADKIIHTGDTNTAIRFPAADTVTIETGGTERLRVNSSGHLGVGAANNTSYDTNAQNLLLASSGNTGITIRSGGSSHFALIHFADGTSGSAQQRAGRILYQHDGNNMSFHTDNTERLRIKGAGQVLIGTTTEGHADADDLTLQAPSGYTGITLRSGTTAGGAIYFSDATSGTGELDGQIVYSQNSRTMTFATAGVTKLTLKSDGLLVPRGIQVTQNVTPTSGNGVEVFAPSSSVGQIQAYDRDNSQWNDFIIKGQTIQIYANNSERLRIDSSGRLLVGTSSSYNVPATIAGAATNVSTGTGSYAVLSLADTSSAAADVGGGVAFQGNDGVNTLVTFSQVQGFKENSSSGDYAGALRFSTRVNGSALTEKMRIASNGRMGLGTNSPEKKLHISDTSGPAQIRITGSSGSSDIYADANIYFQPNGTTRVTMKSSGQLLIGTTTANGYADRLLTVGDASTSNVTAEIRSSAQGQISFADGVAQDVSSYRGLIGYNHASDYMYFYTNSAERLRMDSSGRLGVGRNSSLGAKVDVANDGLLCMRICNTQETGHGTHDAQLVAGGTYYQNLKLSGSDITFNTYNGSSFGERARIQKTGGISFNGDTAQANALDDYEEGTWTPTLAKAGTSGTVTSPGNAYGFYRKIGSLLWISFYWYKASGSFGTGAGQWYIMGLPYNLITLQNSAYQFVPSGYMSINGSIYNFPSSVSGATGTASGSRWQSNGINGAASLSLYGLEYVSNWSSGALEFSGCGFLMTT